MDVRPLDFVHHAVEYLAEVLRPLWVIVNVLVELGVLAIVSFVLLIVNLD